jgi:hypothetical protein
MKAKSKKTPQNKTASRFDDLMRSVMLVKPEKKTAKRKKG